MARAANDRDEQMKAASFFLGRAQEAMAAADDAPSEDASAAYYKEAETWLYMAGQCLNPARAAPPPLRLPPPPPRVGRERRSFMED
ncbi:hypothetical protein [Phenylobacterium zucineum]|uniref:hypothetical protein n=1 Tax=Phenylobacterium zucineum TaxID=284016 RepID=UPI0002E77009|nr:hypothetical protein [Phenylobacterium zucineum]